MADERNTPFNQVFPKLVQLTAQGLLETGDGGSGPQDLLDDKVSFSAGSNENGSWLKLYTSESSGVLVCFHRLEFSGTIAVTTAFAGGFRSTGPAAGTWVYPHPFSGPPVYIPHLLRGDAIPVRGGFSTSPNSQELSIWRATSTTTNFDLIWNLIAIGPFDDEA